MVRYSSSSRMMMMVVAIVVAVCLVTVDAEGRRRRSRFHRKGTGVHVIGSIEFDEHHQRHDYGGLDYTNQLFKKRFIDYEKSDKSSDDSAVHSDDHELDSVGGDDSY